MADALKILSSMAPREVLADAASLYGEQRSIRVSTSAAGGVDVARRVEAAEAVDVVVLASDAITRLIDGGKLSVDGRVDLMTSGIAIAVRAGAVHPNVADEAALKDLVLCAASVGYSTGPSGTYLEKLFATWGIREAIRERLVVPAPGIPVARLIAQGEVALGFQQLSELINAPGIEVVGLMPEPVQLTTIFTAAMSPTCTDRDAAKEFMAFVASPEMDAIKRRHGMGSVR